MLDNLLFGFGVALSWSNLAFCFVGVTAGTLIGVLPGIGPLAGVALLLPLTYSLPPIGAIIMLAGMYYGAQYGGSTTSILLRLPGDSSSVVTALDGYAMAQRGRAGAALTIAALSSFVAGTLSTLLLALAAPPLAAVALSFGPADYFSLVVLGLIAAAGLGHGSVAKSVAMVALGLLLGIVGIDITTGMLRFTLGLRELEDGIDLVSVAIGLFGFSHIIFSLEESRSEQRAVAPIHKLSLTRQELRDSALPTVRGSLLGSLLGVLPGGGAVLSSFVSYALEKRISKQPDAFGQGAAAGVAGPESANNAAAQTSFIPLLTLGIPPNAVIALIGGAMVLQGITPGPEVIDKQPALFWGVVASMWIGNLMLLLLNLPLVGLWVQLLKIPQTYLFPAVILFASIGVYSTNGRAFDVFLAAAFGVLGYGLLKLRFEPAPLMLGFVLGPLLEENFKRALLLSRGDLAVFVTEPKSLVLLGLATALLCVFTLPSIARRRHKVFAESDN